VVTEPKVKRDANGRVLAGSSLNPAGRRAGASWVQRVRKSVDEEDLVRLLTKLCQEALAGDREAAALLLKYCLPLPKPVGESLEAVGDAGSTLAIAQRVVSAMAAGNLEVGAAKEALDALKQAADLEDRAELLERVERLERQLGGDAV
jgi:hypothetical protein